MENNLIYEDAIAHQGKHGSPIFYGNLTITKSTKHGNSTKIKQVDLLAKNQVLCGTYDQIKEDHLTLLKACARLKDRKLIDDDLTDLSKFKITKIEILTFLSYSSHENKN